MERGKGGGGERSYSREYRDVRMAITTGKGGVMRGTCGNHNRKRRGYEMQVWLSQQEEAGL